ncbi:MAG: response regulator transcription factor [Patescibacteria group bacterium]
MRILVVEDEHRVANTIKKGLEQERYAVDTVYDGDAGYDLASTEDYDLIILDLMLPGIDGLEICRRLRAEKNHTPILILTARSQVEDKVAGLNMGADDYLAKPFSFEELLARVKALVRRPKAIVEDSSGLEKYHLSRKEFTLLEYLIRNPNKILSKEQIIAHVWNYDADILINTVEVYIKKLRQKIKNDFLIETVRGFGYRLCTKPQE